MKKTIVDESLFAIRMLIVVLCVVCGVVPAWAGHDGPHYAKVTVTAKPTGQGKVYMTTKGDYLPEDGDWQNSMSATWNCNDGVNNEEDSRTYYVHAQASSGYHFEKWSSKSDGSDSKSTDAKYAYSTSAESESSGSPTANNIYAIFEVNPTYTCTMLTSENGTYKYKYGDSEEVTVESQHSVTTNQNFTFTALPAAGYELYGWYTESGGTKTYFDYSSYSLPSYALPGNVRIGVDFMPVGTPLFQIKGAAAVYMDLNAAVTACGGAAKTIVLINNGTLPAGEYTIPTNVTLLIPFDAVYTCYTETPGTIDSYTFPAAYRTLTMSPGARLIVNGKISLSAKVSGKSYAGPCGAPSESYGAIKMLSEGETKSTITLNNGAKLYSWGYIYGEGAVEVLSGAEVHEGFAFMDFRGAQNTYDMTDDSHKVFPFNQYYIQNIEVPLTIHYGATEKVFSCLYPGGSEVKIPITMVGSSDGLFRLSGEGSKLTKWYDPHDDRQHYALEGNAAIRNISFTVTLIMSITVNSANFVLPITNNMDITVRSGATVSIAEDICILPDASVTVEQGATVNIAKNVYVYDKQAYTNANTYTTSQGGYPEAGPGRYAAGAYVRCIAYSPSWATIPDREIRRLAIMHTARFKINGTLNVNGKLYTTEGGADIFSTADGAAIRLVSGAGTADKTYQVDHQNYDAYYYSIPITSAQLHNADQSYATTVGNAAGITWIYKHGHWGWKVVWKLEDGSVLKTAYHYAQPDASWISLNAPSTDRANEGTCSYSFNGWNTTTNTENQEVTVVADYTKTCTNYYTVTWMSEDGTETLETDEQVGQGENTRYNGAMPFKPFDTESSRLYTFDGWATEPNGEKVYDIDGTPAASGDAIYYAHFAVTEVVAIVKADDDTTYCTSIAEAFEVVRNTNFTPTIQVWKDASIPAMVYNIENYCTLDLNGHTLTSVTSSVQSPFNINKSYITFTITDSSESQSGKLSMTTTYGSTIFGLFVQNGNLQLNGGTIEVISGSATTCGVTVNSNCSFTMNGGKIHVVTSNNKEGRGIYSVGTVLINDGTIHVEAAGSAYAIKREGSTITVNGGKFNINGSSSYINYGSDADANITIKGGYYTTNSRLANVVPSPYLVYDWASPEEPYHYTVAAKVGYTVTFQNTDETPLQTGIWVEGTTPAYAGETPTKPGDTEGAWMLGGWTPDLVPVTEDVTYTAVYVPTPPVASVTIGRGDPTEYIHFNDAWTAANSATDASTLTLLQDVTVTTQLTYNNSNNKNCILDLNGHTLTSNTSQQSPLHINNTNVTFTITDGTENKSGKLSLNTSSSSTIFGAYVENGHLLLNGGTIEVTSSTATACGVTINKGTFTMNGGTIHVKTTNGKEGRGIYANSTTTVNGGTVHVDAAGTAYGIRHDAGTMTINDGKFSISGSTASYMNYKEEADTKLIIKGGYYNISNRLGTYVSAPYHIFDLTSGAEFDEGYRYKVTEGYTLAWETDGELSGEGYTPAGHTAVGTPIVAPTSTKEGYVFAGWTPSVAETMPAANTTYTAQWAVASVTIGETTTLYTTFAPAWTAANSATAASTLKLLDDVDLTTGLEYTNASKNCTLDLNGHIISGSATPLFKIAQDGITFTITDLTEAKEGRIECNTNVSGQQWAVEVTKSTLRFEGGTIYAKNTQAGTLFIGIYSGASGVIEISGGNIHTVTTAANPAYGVLTFGTATISGGSFKVESGAAGYAVEAYGDNTNILITGGNFYATGSSAACVHRNKGTLTLRGGYYNSDTNLAANCATNYHVFPNDDATYLYKVAEGYTVTFKNSDVTLQSGLWEKGATPLYSGETPAKAADAQYTYTFNDWNAPIAPVTANVTYTAQFSSTVNTYTVTWKDANGTTLETDENVPYGTTPAYNGATPTKAKDAEYAYTFNGWSPAVSAVTGDATYTATYTTTPVVASVTVNASGKTFYYTDFSTAFAEANGATFAVTITLLKDVSSAALQYSGANTDCTLDLNGHTLTSTATQLILNINKVGSTFTITDKTESKSGQMRIEATNTSEAYSVYVSHGHLKLEAGTIYASLVATTGAGVRAVNANSSFTMDGGTIHVVTTNAKNGIGVTASNGTTTINDGTILVEAAKDGYGINRTGGTVTVDGGKFNISATGSAYATNQTSANATVVIRGGYYTTNSQLNPTTPHHVFGLTSGAEFDEGYRYKVAEGYTVTFKNGDVTLQSGLWEKGATPLYSGETPAKAADAQYTYTFNGWNVPIAPVTADVIYTAQFSSTVNTYTVTWKNNDGTTLETDENVPYGNTPEYNGATPTKATDAEYAYTFNTWSPTVSAVTGDATYTATYTTTPVVASVTVNSTTAYYTSFADAWTVANSGSEDATLTLLQDVSVTTQLAYTNSNNQNCTLDLNGHTLTNNTDNVQSPLHINNTNVTFTITDGTVDKSGKLSLNTSFSSSAIFGAFVDNGTLLLNAGTIEVISGTAATCGVTANSNGTFTMNGGTIHVKTTANNKEGRGVYSVGRVIINDGTIHVEAAGTAYGIKRDNGTVTVNNGKFNVTGSPANVTNHANVVIKGGYYNIDTNLETCVASPYHVFPNDDAIYRHKVAEGHTLTWNLDGGTISVAGTPAGYVAVGDPITAPTVSKTGYTFTGWSTEVAQTMPANDVTYTATWEYNGVACVTINGTTTYYMTIAAAFNAANASTTYEPTITLLKDAATTTTSMLSYTGAKNCTLNLNGHTLSSTTVQALLYINKEGITFTITDLTESKSGTLHLESSFTDKTWCVYVAKGNLQMDAGTVFLRSKANTYNEGIRIDPAASTFTMNGGKVHVKTSDGKPARGIVSRGIAAIRGGEIQVEASGIGYGIEARVSDDGNNIGNVTVNGGKFLVTGTTAACAYRSDNKATLKLQGGYYNSDTSLATYVSAPYQVLSTGDATYPFTVAENVTDITVNANETTTIDVNTTTTITTVHVSGTLNVSQGVTLTTDDLILEATPSSSGEIIGDVAATNAYFDLSGDFKARTWYAVAVPWQVDVPAYDVAHSGVSTKKGEGGFVLQELGRSYDLIYYDGALRATGASKAWKYVEDDPASKQVMVPGRAYMIYLTTDANVIRFRKSANAALHTNTLAVYEYDSDEPKDASWNGIANPATYYAYINANVKNYKTGELNVGQVYNAESKTYSVVDMNANNMVVGQPVFVQATATNESVVVYADYDDAFHAAPRRTNAQETSMTRYEVMFAPNEGDVTDRIIVRLDEEKEENTYVVGQDLVKMGVSDMVPQMWVDRYDSKMCINTVAPVNNRADYPLGISVQQSGAYDLFIDDQPDDETMLYLTYDGEAIWNLSYGGYVVNLEKGTNSHYGLRIVYTPQTATGIENVQRDNVQCTKVLMDDHVFIIRGGNIYTMDGQLVK